MSTAAPWRPPSDDQLTWFRPGGRLAARPRPFDYGFEIYALVWGVTRALESLYFPLYALRTRLVDGHLYLAAVPSAFAERDLPAQLQRMRDSGLRFTRNVRGAWERFIRAEVVEYNAFLAEFPPEVASNAEVADQLLRLRRTRGNQWFAATRAVFAPVAMLEHGERQPIPSDTRSVVSEALELIRDRGGALLEDSVRRVGRRLVERGAIDRAGDIFWLELQEVREALRTGCDLRDQVLERSGQRERWPRSDASEIIGPVLPPDAPRMYLVREVLEIVSSAGGT